MTRMIDSQKGQFTMEAVLLLVVLVSALFLGIGYLKDNSYVQNIIQGPWQTLAGVIETGQKIGPGQAQGGGILETARRQHPNHISRHATFEGDIL